MKKQTSPPNRRGRLVLLCFVLGLILIVMLVGTVYLQHLLGRIHYVDSGTAPTLSPEELDAYLATQPEEINTAPTMDPEDVTFPDYDADIGRDSDIINILLIGQDRREDETRARSDSMILCTFHKSEKKLTMTSFLRDTYVKIPGYGQNRINVAYAAGGMSLLNKTLENNFGVHIDGNVEVDFYQFADIVDLLGGVEVDLRNDEAQWVNRETGEITTWPTIRAVNIEYAASALPKQDAQTAQKAVPVQDKQEQSTLPPEQLPGFTGYEPFGGGNSYYPDET